MKLWLVLGGCGIFNIGASSLIPSGSGGLAFLEYYYISQGTIPNKLFIVRTNKIFLR